MWPTCFKGKRFILCSMQNLNHKATSMKMECGCGYMEHELIVSPYRRTKYLGYIKWIHWSAFIRVRRRRDFLSEWFGPEFYSAASQILCGPNMWSACAEYGVPLGGYFEKKLDFLGVSSKSLICKAGNIGVRLNLATLATCQISPN